MGRIALDEVSMAPLVAFWELASPLNCAHV